MIYKIAKVQKGDLSMASTPRFASASAAPSPKAGMPLEAALRYWLAELQLSNCSQTTIDWCRDLFQGRILPALTRQGFLICEQILHCDLKLRFGYRTSGRDRRR